MFSSKMNINCQKWKCGLLWCLHSLFVLCISLYSYLQIASTPVRPHRFHLVALALYAFVFFLQRNPYYRDSFEEKTIIDDACLCVQKTRWTGYRCLVLSCFRMFSIEEGPGMYHVSPCSRCVKSFLKGNDRRTKVVGLVAPVAVLLSPRPLLLHRRWIKGWWPWRGGQMSSQLKMVVMMPMGTMIYSSLSALTGVLKLLGLFHWD